MKIRDQRGVVKRIIDYNLKAINLNNKNNYKEK
jgi:hypothetical protein